MADRYNVLISRSWAEVDSVMQLMPRQNGCVKCDTSSKLSCPENCTNGTTCGYEVLLDCTQCPKAVCVSSSESSDPDADTSSSSSSSGSGGPNIGAIVGGVVGGVVVVALATYLVWKFCIKAKRPRNSDSVVDYGSRDVDEATMAEKEIDDRRAQRSSMHTVHSIASTVLTRASNIIQIAYIPGVTNRANPHSPGHLVPPVPAIPMGLAQGGGGGGSGNMPRGGAGTPATPFEDQHFFMPGDLRDSTYSGYSAMSDQTSYAHTSYAPRSSVASTIYGKVVTVQAPAQTGMRAKPTVVSVNVRSSGNSPDSETPPVPNIDFDRYARPSSGLSNFSVGSTFLNNANTATPVRAQVIKVNGIPKATSPLANSAMASNDRLSPLSAVQSVSNDEPATAASDQSPFSDPDSRHSSLSASIEDATRRAAKISSKRSSSAVRDTSPFGDEHATKDQ